MSYEEPWNRDSLITKEKIKLICSGKGYRQKDHETRTGGVTYENSVADDLELFYDDIKRSKRPVSMAWTYFLPELTPKELELVENKDEEYMRSFKLLNNADVNETEMQLSSSSSKYLIAYCRRKTIAIGSQNFSDETQESISANEENLTPSFDLNITEEDSLIGPKHLAGLLMLICLILAVLIGGTSKTTKNDRLVKEAVLILSTKPYEPGLVPMVITSTTTGESHFDDINFAYEPQTEAYGCCAATLDGEMFVLGGWTHVRQVITQKRKKPDICL